jgi:hypothetical protein
MSFEIGESVEYKPPGSPAGVFLVLRRMPDDPSGEPMYRIKSGLEYHERNVLEMALTKLGASPQKSEPSMWRQHDAHPPKGT